MADIGEGNREMTKKPYELAENIKDKENPHLIMDTKDNTIFGRFPAKSLADGMLRLLNPKEKEQ